MTSPIVRQVAILIALIAVAVGVAGRYHFVYGAGRSLERLEKVSWSLSETVVNLDEVSGLPLIVVRIKYPLLLQALERER